MDYDSLDNNKQDDIKENHDATGMEPNVSGNRIMDAVIRNNGWNSLGNLKARNIILGIVLILVSLGFPYMSKDAWMGTIYKIREAIVAGDSGHLILAAAILCLLCAVQSNFQFLGTILLVDNIPILQSLDRFKSTLLTISVIVVLHTTVHVFFDMPYELVIVVLASVLSIFIYDRLLQRGGIIPITIVSTQLFFALQWLIIMPMFTQYAIGQSDIPMSIKIASQYLDASTVLNFTGIAFFLPFVFSAFVTTILFISYAQNIKVMRENYEKESQIKNMKAKILENRIYKEVKSIIHDLKTPLVTIRGLNSLLAISKDEDKIIEYTDRIENSVIRMNDMISSFLFDSMKQNLKATELISFVRAQLPLDDDTIKTDFVSDEILPDIHINKVRVARAVINILENAIIVPCTSSYKHIIFESRGVENGLLLKISDNGIGIKPEDMDRIWEVGFSLNKTSGLGLPFAKQIIEDNSGTIELESIAGKGTVVTIFLPSEQELEKKKEKKYE